MAAREFLGHALQGVGVGHHLRQIDALTAERIGELVAQHRFGHEAKRHQLTADRQAGRLLLLEPDAQLVERNQALGDQGFAHAEFLASFHGGKTQRTGFSCCTRASAWARSKRCAPPPASAFS